MDEILPANTPIQLADTIGGVLSAIVDAQRAAAETTVRYIQDIGLVTNEEGTINLRTTSFRFKKLDENQVPGDFELEVPLLSLVPIPAISIKSATIKFAYEIVTTIKEDEKTEGGSIPSGSQGRFGRIPQLWGRVAPTSRTTSETSQLRSNLDIEIHIETPDPAAGLGRILDMLELAALEHKVPPPSPQ